MKVNTTNRVYIISESSKYNKCFMGALILRYIDDVVIINDKVVTLMPSNRFYELADEEDAAKQTLVGADMLRDLELGKTMKDNPSCPDSVTFEIKLERETCGYIDFCNLKNIITKQNINMPDSMINGYGIIFLIEAAKFDEQLKDTAAAIKSCHNASSMHMQIAVIDIEKYLKKNPDFTFERMKEEMTRSLAEMMRNCNFECDIEFCSFANLDYDKVYDEYGNIKENPDFEPYNIEVVVNNVIYKTSECIDMHLRDVIEQSKYVLRTRIGRYNKRNVRALLEIQEARKNIGVAKIGHFPVLNTLRLFKIDERIV